MQEMKHKQKQVEERDVFVYINLCSKVLVFVVDAMTISTESVLHGPILNGGECHSRRLCVD